MDQQNVPITPPTPVPVPVLTPQPKSVMPPILIYTLIAVILVLIGIIGVLIVKPRVAPAIPTPIPTPIQATPSPIQTLSPLATESAFLQFASSVASLSAAVSGNTIQDQALDPPVLILPLGF
jgi:hypothetical protein